jgi:hypothetical protein
MSKALQSFVERIVTDPGFRKAFIAMPLQDILKRQVVSPTERRALVRARRRLLMAAPGQQVGFDPFEWP